VSAAGASGASLGGLTRPLYAPAGACAGRGATSVGPVDVGTLPAVAVPAAAGTVAAGAVAAGAVAAGAVAAGTGITGRLMFGPGPAVGLNDGSRLGTLCFVLAAGATAPCSGWVCSGCA